VLRCAHHAINFVRFSAQEQILCLRTVHTEVHVIGKQPAPY
jgi:hypothetical protein